MKALRLNWITRVLNNTAESWKTIPSYYFEKHGGLSFVVNYNYNVKKKQKTIEQ